MTFEVSAAEAGHTLAKVLRSRMHETRPSWNQVRAMIEGRRVKLGGGVCTDPSRRLNEGDPIELLESAERIPRNANPTDLVIRHLDDHIVVVEKPAGISSVRHPAELEWTDSKRQLDPTLQDLTQWAIAQKLKRPAKSLPPLRVVHRLDKETSGLVVFARSVPAERGLGMQFRKHTVIRRYLAIVPGHMNARTIRGTLVRDRGDGRRGSTRQPDATGKIAVTHVEVEQQYAIATLLSCRLETGRTHQIRIHLSEAGHPIGGERVYTKTKQGVDLPKLERAPRLCLHATELGFVHPTTEAKLHWTMPLPGDLQCFLNQLRSRDA
jgi:23S rRNA pseudouridine1911/1915/1917 synthase